MIAKILILLIALLHFYILAIEMFMWETKGRKIFKGAMPDNLFTPTKVMAANQGLYNGFLAAGLVWSLLIADADCGKSVALFFLSCVAIAGMYGAYSASRKIFYVQTVPAVITIVVLLVT